MPGMMGIPPEAIKRLLMQGGDPASMFAGDPSQQQSQTSAPGGPQPGAIAGAIQSPTQAPPTTPAVSPAAPSTLATPSSGAVTDQLFKGAPSPQNAPIAQAPTRYHHGKLASAFLGIGEALGNPLATRIGERDRTRQQEIDEYNRQQPALQYQANVGAQKTRAELTREQAQTRNENAQAANAEQMLPAQEQAQKVYEDLSKVWQEKSVPDFDTYAATKLQGVPAFVARRVQPSLAAIKQLPQTGRGYTLNMQDDLPTSIGIYGKNYDRKDPELMKQPSGAAAAADFDRALAAHGTKRSEKLSDEKEVQGAAAERQAAGFAQATKMEETKKVQPHIDEALGADERLSRMEGSYKKALKGDQQAMLALLSDHLGMTISLQKGARITKDVLQGAEESQPWLEKIGAKFDNRGYLSGVALGPEQMKQMLDLGYEARDRSYAAAHAAATTYGQPLPEGFIKTEQKRTPGGKPALQGEQASDVIYARDLQGQLHKAAKGTVLPKGWKADNAPAATK